MHWITWIVLLLALVEAGWLAFDGARALLVGDYVTPRSGRYAGQLGPWAKLVSAVGIDPRSRFMKSAHLLIGSAWLVVGIGFGAGVDGAASGMLICAVVTLWYAPWGTVLSLLQIMLLIWLKSNMHS